MNEAVESWVEANKRALLTELDRIHAALERHAGRETPEPGRPAGVGDPPTLARLCESFGLSAFERDVLLLCAGAELDTRFSAVLRELGSAAPTMSLALAALPQAHWSALSPAGPLRYWRLLELGEGDTAPTSPLRIDERVLHFLTATGALDRRLADLLVPLPEGGPLPPSQEAVAAAVAALWTDTQAPSVVCLCGDDRLGKRAVARAACARLGLDVYLLPAGEIPAAAPDRATLSLLWEREAALSGSALMIDADDRDAAESAAVLPSFVERLRSFVLVASREPLPLGVRPAIHLDVDRPSSEEQLAAWRAALGDDAARLNGSLSPLAGHFDLGVHEIRTIGAHARSLAAAEPDELPRRLWEACRRHARPRLEGLAQRIDAAASWDDLVLPEPQFATLREISLQVRWRTHVYETWGFGPRGTRGLGISALFHGTSGTGKTLAAEVLACELQLDLYRIDLSAVVSKYIGETEKNLRRVFDAAEEGGAVLLFDEADALFGKRTEVKDSHDRYANIEVSYLLQRMETYGGLAILTTNMKSALDQAFLRRLRFVVAFPFPDAVQRARIWDRAFPEAAPTEGLDRELLARLNVPGGSIRNIALGAAFVAADAGTPVTMAHVLRAAKSEYAKLERPLSEAEIGAWP